MKCHRVHRLGIRRRPETGVTYLDAPVHDQAENFCFLLLAEPVDSVDGLVFDRWCPVAELVASETLPT
jgi:hypothetical protein